RFKPFSDGASSRLTTARSKCVRTLAHKGRRGSLAAPIDSFSKARKSPQRTGSFSMRGLLMALLAFDASSHDAAHRAGRFGASIRSSKILGSSKTTAKKTTTKTV
ncbi:hypothetical protein, partial [Mesorhizobium sp.]|uniref:hypothetical protein n=1 Tax=Mesorhizobium sp. TaxID=1871066 RepID=UPI0025FA4284